MDGIEEEDFEDAKYDVKELFEYTVREEDYMQMAKNIKDEIMRLREFNNWVSNMSKDEIDYLLEALEEEIKVDDLQ